MPPKRTFQRTLSNASSTSSSSNKGKLKQNKLDFSFHSTSSSRAFGSRPLTTTPSFSLPSAPPAPTASSSRPPPPLPSVSTAGIVKGKQRQVDFSTKEEASDADSLWSERLAPRTAEELAIHPKKVAQVRGWLEEAFSSKLAKHRKVLALTGPAGAGKSATIRALSSAQDLDFDLIEWHNDQPPYDADNPGQSFVERFTDFLSKAAKFPTLDFQAADDEGSGSSSSLDPGAQTSRRRVILLEDLPNLHHLPTKQLFQAAIEQHINQSIQLTARGFANVPIVSVITESTPREDEDRWAGDGSSSWRDRIASIMDTRTALGEGIRRHPAYAEVRFNPVAPTIVLKGLKRAIETTGKQASKTWLQLLQAIAEDSNGDLRAAVNCLQFVGANSEVMEMVAKQKGSKRGEGVQKAMRRLMPLVSGRESSLALFHALGRVLYNKRMGDPGDDGGGRDAGTAEDSDSDQDDSDSTTNHLKRRLRRAMAGIIQPSSSDDLNSLPEHMSHLSRSTSRVSPDQLWADLPVDSSIFQLYLHQNFTPFCTEIEQCESILDAFSTADALLPLHEAYRYSSVSSYYAFLISTRGTLLGLPSPVPRSGQKLGKATWWDVQKKLRSVLVDIDDVKAGSMGKVEREDAGGGRFKRTKFSNPSSEDVQRSDAGLGDDFLHTTLLRSDAVTLVTEVLPLLAKIRPGADGKVTELARMRFEYAGVADMASRVLDEHETGAVAGDEDEDELPKHKQQQQQQQQGMKRKHPVEAEEEQEEQEKLVLSDDDIADF